MARALTYLLLRQLPDSKYLPHALPYQAKPRQSSLSQFFENCKRLHRHYNPPDSKHVRELEQILQQQNLPPLRSTTINKAKYLMTGTGGRLEALDALVSVFLLE